MIVASSDATASLPQELAERLAESLRAPGAFAVDAGNGALIAPAGAALDQAAREALLAFAQDQRGTAAALLDLPLDGAKAPPTPSACRILLLDGRRRVIVVVPIDGGAHDAAAASARSPAASEGPPVRILWQSDAEGRITHIGEQLRRMMGDQAGAVAGRRWADLIGDVMLDPAEEIVAALNRRETASGVELLWSSDQEAGPATLLWSGVPVFDSGRRFRGFRGFLLAPARLARATQAQPAPAAEAAPPVEPRQEPAPAQEETAQKESAAPAPAPAPPQTVIAPLPAPTLPAMPHLSSAERNAFREIARALGVRGVEDAESQPSAPPARPELRIVSSTPALAKEPPAEPPAVENDPVEPPALAADERLEDETIEPPVEQPALEAPAAIDAPEDEQEEQEQEESAAPVDEAESGIAALADDEPPPPPANDSAPPVFETIQARVAALAASLAREEQQARIENAPAPQESPGPQESPAEQPEPVVAPAAAQIATQPPPVDPVARHAREMLDRLPVGLLVNRGSMLLFANRTLMDLLDFPSMAAIEAHGGVAGLFKGRAPMSDRDGPTGPVLLNARDGDSIAVDARLQGIEWDDGPATLVTFRRALDVEISQRLKATELDLRAREAELRETRAVLDTATDGVAVIDEDGRIMTLNRAAEALFGFDQNEVAGESITTLFAPESHAQAGDYFEGLKSGGVRSVLNDGREIVGRVRQGGRIPLFVTIGQISDRPSRKFCAVMRDLTNWKKTERDLIDARKAAEDASAQKSDFLAKISHEVRTPLNAIIGFAEVMMEERFGPVGNDRYKDYLRDIHSSGGHVISLVNDLLDLSKIEAGKMELDFVSVGVNDIIRGAVNLMQPQSQRARVVVRSALAGKLPAVVADERSLKQIVINLLSNAVKFTDSGGQVIVSTTLTDLGEVAIRIRDTGIGMTEKELTEAMEPFRQLATSRRAGGTGLGLPLTRALVEANRAHLKMSSVKNEGTLVEVVFPPTRVLAE